MISAIAAMSENRVIGVKNSLPWNIPEDMAFFRTTTREKTVIMGRKTFDSLGKALPKRRNIVITRDAQWTAKDIEVVSSLEAALLLCKNEAHEVFIIGGAQIYAQALPYLDRLYLTVIHKKYEGDAFFPEVDLQKDFKIISEKNCFQTEPEAVEFTFFIADKKIN